MPAPDGPQFDKHQIMADMHPHLQRAGLSWTVFAGKLHKTPSLQHMTRNERLRAAEHLRVNKPEVFQQMLDSFKNG